MKILTLGLDETTLAFLHRSGMTTETQVVDGPEDFMDWISGGFYDATVLDLEETGLGIYAARAVRTRKIDVPIIGISYKLNIRTWGDHRAMFLENGGDDLLKGPPNPRELAATLRATTRRLQGGALNIIELRSGGAVLKINLTTGTARVNDTDPELTGKEFELLRTLAESSGRALSKQQILSAMYRDGVEDEPEVKIIDVFACKLRAKLVAKHPDAQFVGTVRGRGYCLTEPLNTKMDLATA